MCTLINREKRIAGSPQIRNEKFTPCHQKDQNLTTYKQQHSKLTSTPGLHSGHQLMTKTALIPFNPNETLPAQESNCLPSTAALSKAGYQVQRKAQQYHTHTHKVGQCVNFFKQSIFILYFKKILFMFIQQCMNIQQKSQNGNDTKQPLLTRALLGKASTIFLATQWLAKIMHSAIVSWTSRCCTEQSTNDLLHHNKVAREID